MVNSEHTRREHGWQESDAKGRPLRRRPTSGRSTQARRRTSRPNRRRTASSCVGLRRIARHIRELTVLKIPYRCVAVTPAACQECRCYRNLFFPGGNALLGLNALDLRRLLDMKRSRIPARHPPVAARYIRIGEITKSSTPVPPTVNRKAIWPSSVGDFDVFSQTSSAASNASSMTASLPVFNTPARLSAPGQLKGHRDRQYDAPAHLPCLRATIPFRALRLGQRVVLSENHLAIRDRKLGPNARAPKSLTPET
jgi:hypothetical protein